jgi:hypothetical protein
MGSTKYESEEETLNLFGFTSMDLESIILNIINIPLLRKNSYNLCHTSNPTIHLAKTLHLEI